MKKSLIFTLTFLFSISFCIAQPIKGNQAPIRSASSVKQQVNIEPIANSNKISAEPLVLDQELSALDYDKRNSGAPSVVSSPSKTLNQWVLPFDGSSSANCRAPGNTFNYQRTEYLITPAEMAASGFPSGSTVNGIGFYVSTPGLSSQIGELKVYLKNTTDVTYTLGNTWTTAGFTYVSNNISWIVPITAGAYMIPFVGGSTFTYTGGGVYVAWEFVNTGPAGLSALVANCNKSLAGGLVGFRGSFQSTNLTPSDFRPATQFMNSSIIDIADITSIYTFEKVAVGFGTPTPINVFINNPSDSAATFDVTITVNNAANTITRYTATKTINGLASKTSTTVTFTGWTPTILENVNISATTSVIPNETWTSNNTRTIQANVNNAILGYNFNNTAPQSWGFTYPSTGLFVSKFKMNGIGFVDGANIMISNSTSNIGNTIYAVVLNSVGNIVAQSANYVILSGDLGVNKSFTFPSLPIFLDEEYYVGLAQTAGTAQWYPLGAFIESPQRPGAFYTAPITGGALSESPTSNNLKFGIEAHVSSTAGCLPPTKLKALNTASTSANLTWQANGIATSWEYVYGFAPLPAPTGSGITTTSSSSNQLTGLTPNSSYQFYVRSNCGGSKSSWIGPVDFSTTIDFADVTNIYTLEKVAVGFGTPTPIMVRVYNHSASPATFDVTLTVKDTSNTITRYTSTQTVTSLAGDSSKILTFTGWSPSIIEDVNITATASAVPTETWTVNNTRTIQSKVNNEIMSYDFNSNIYDGYGFSFPATGIFASKFTMNGNGYVNGATLLIGTWPNNVGDTIYAVVMNDTGTIVAQSDNYIIKSNDLGVKKNFIFTTPPSFNNKAYYVGLAQTKGVLSWYPMGVYNETPSRTGAFYTTEITGGTLTELKGYNIKLGIEAIVGSSPISIRTVNLNVFLEGLYAGGGAMNQAKDVSGPKFPAGIADKITVELHDPAIYDTVVYRRTNLDLSTNGFATFNIVTSYYGSYYITIKHRNSIETTSAFPVSFAGSSINYNFTNAANKAYGSNMRAVSGGYFAIFGGEAFSDGYVDGKDMSIVDNYSTPPPLMGYHPEDLNGDGIIDGSDMAIVDNNSTVPYVERKVP